MGVRSRRMEGHVQTATVSPGVLRGGHVESQRLDCSPGPTKAPTRASRDTLKSQTSKCRGSRVPPDLLTPWAPELTKEAFPPHTSPQGHLQGCGCHRQAHAG